MENRLISIKINNIIKYIDYLNKAKLKLEKEKDEFEIIILKNSIAKFIEEIIENAIKINTYILKENDLFAENYFQTFEKLKQIYQIEEDFLTQIAKTTSFRNNIVHNYENERTQENLIENIEPIIFLYKEYVKLIKKNLKEL